MSGEQRGASSAGILLFRVYDRLEVLLGHMGGPLWSKREAGAWSVPKGEPDGAETAEAAARREFSEELGVAVPDGELIDLGRTRQSGGKVVTVFALRGELDPEDVVPGTFRMEWPRGSGRIREFPELDRVAWFDVDEADGKLVRGQRVFLTRLAEHLQR